MLTLTGIAGRQFRGGIRVPKRRGSGTTPTGAGWGQRGAEISIGAWAHHPLYKGLGTYYGRHGRLASLLLTCYYNINMMERIVLNMALKELGSSITPHILLWACQIAALVWPPFPGRRGVCANYLSGHLL